MSIFMEGFTGSMKFVSFMAGVLSPLVAFYVALCLITFVIDYIRARRERGNENDAGT